MRLRPPCMWPLSPVPILRSARGRLAGSLVTMLHVGALALYIPSPPINSFHIGPLDIHFYALGYIVGIFFAIWITRARWRKAGGDPDLINEIALWVVPAGIVGGRIYFDVTTPMDIPHVWYGIFAVWTGGLGIWGGVALAAVVGGWRLKRLGITAGAMANAIAPALLVAQGIGRIGNYFNKELFGKPSTLPWAVKIPYQYRVSGGIPAQDLRFSTFQPSFLYELIFDLLCAVFLIWLSRRVKFKPWALFALYVAGYSGYRIFEESIRIDSSEYILGMRLNFWVALFGTVAGLVWFAIAQTRRDKPVSVRSTRVRATAGEVPPDEAATAAGGTGAQADAIPAVADDTRTGGATSVRSEELRRRWRRSSRQSP